MALSLSLGCGFYFRLHLVMSTTFVHRVCFWLVALQFRRWPGVNKLVSFQATDSFWLLQIIAADCEDVCANEEDGDAAGGAAHSFPRCCLGWKAALQAPCPWCKVIALQWTGHHWDCSGTLPVSVLRGLSFRFFSCHHLVTFRYHLLTHGCHCFSVPASSVTASRFLAFTLPYCLSTLHSDHPESLCLVTMIFFLFSCHNNPKPLTDLYRIFCSFSCLYQVSCSCCLASLNSTMCSQALVPWAGGGGGGGAVALTGPQELIGKYLRIIWAQLLNINSVKPARLFQGFQWGLSIRALPTLSAPHPTNRASFPAQCWRE